MPARTTPAVPTQTNLPADGTPAVPTQTNLPADGTPAAPTQTAVPTNVTPAAPVPTAVAHAPAPSPLDRWAPEAQKLASSELHLAVPFHVHLGEATDVARFHKKYYASVEARDGQPERAGLDTVADERRGLTAMTGDDILSLREATQQAHTRYLMTASPGAASPIERGRYIVGEIMATLGYLFDDGVEDERDAQLAAVQASHAEHPESIDALAAELEDCCALGNLYRSELTGLGGFDPKLLDEAKKVADALRDRPATPAALSDESARALALRNRCAMLLADKMNAVRAAARFVFRHHPEIVREATSAYERRRRAAARRSALKKGKGAADFE
jgi:hypothetical protein